MSTDDDIISTDEDPSLRIESFAVTNLRSVSTKLNQYCIHHANVQGTYIIKVCQPHSKNLFAHSVPLHNTQFALLRTLSQTYYESGPASAVGEDGAGHPIYLTARQHSLPSNYTLKLQDYVTNRNIVTAVQMSALFTVPLSSSHRTVLSTLLNDFVATQNLAPKKTRKVF